MKFSDGAWLWRSDVEPACVRNVIEHHVRDDVLELSVLDRLGREGVDRFEGVVLRVRVSSPMPDVIRVQVRHFEPHPSANFKFDLDTSLRSGDVRIEDTPAALRYTTGNTTLEIHKEQWQMRFLRKGESRPITAASGDCLGYMRVKDQGNFLMQRLDLAVGECIYGMGERFGPLVRNGQTVEVWQRDGGTCSDQAYKNVPFYLSSRGYGLLVNDPGRVEFEVATERVSKIQFSVPSEELDYYLFDGPNLKDVLEKYTRLAGRTALPPAWSFGLWLSTSFTTQYDEQTVNEFVDGMAEREIPLSVFHFDCFWMKQRHWCNFMWDQDAFPHPHEMLRRLKARGLKVCVWINPYISALSEIFDEGVSGGYFLKQPDGNIYQRDQWQPAMALVDFTNPDAVAWYQGKLRALLGMGVDSFKTDFGERIPLDVVYHNGADPTLMHNYYAYLYNKAVFELLEDFHGKGEALVFGRAATAGSQKFPVHWGGDCDATFESMAEDLRGGLSFCLSGNAFWSHDIGGFTGKADPAVYKRWIAFGLMSTHSRLHGSESYRVPWLFDEESVDVMRHFTNLKNKLFPYIYAAAHEARERGLPVMRAMVLEFPDDPGCLYLDRQYMLGESLLVAPVFRHDGFAEYYLPEGRWTHLTDGRLLKGGAWQRERVDFMNIPLFVRENTVLPMSGDDQHPRWGYEDELTLQLFELSDGADLPVRVRHTDGQPAAAFRCTRRGDTITLESDGRAGNVHILLRSRDSVRRVTHGRMTGTTPLGVLIEWTDTARPLVIDTYAVAPVRDITPVVKKPPTVARPQHT